MSIFSLLTCLLHNHLARLILILFNLTYIIINWSKFINKTLTHALNHPFHLSHTDTSIYFVRTHLNPYTCDWNIILTHMTRKLRKILMLKHIVMSTLSLVFHTFQPHPTLFYQDNKSLLSLSLSLSLSIYIYTPSFLSL